jgi:6,7-dimethyl-8-ribityllumazine synthase
VRTIRGSFTARSRRIAIVAAHFNGLVVDKLVAGAVTCLEGHGVGGDDIDLVWTPGAFEIPQAAGRLASSGSYDAVICLGAVIRGATAHFDFVAGEAARGIREVADRTGIPVIFGVLTTETLEQALDRAGGKHGNKGWDAAMAGLEMASLLESLPKDEPIPKEEVQPDEPPRDGAPQEGAG